MNEREISLSDEDLDAVLDALAYKEIDHHGPQGTAIHDIRHAITSLLQTLTDELHDTRAVRAGERWTIPFLMSCGLKGKVVVYISNLGPEHTRPEPDELEDFDPENPPSYSVHRADGDVPYEFTDDEEE